MQTGVTNLGLRPAPPSAGEPFQFFFFSELLNLPICVGKVSQRVGRVTDLVFKLIDPYPEAVGIYVEHSGGRPNEFIPWNRVTKIDDDAVFILAAEEGKPYPPFTDQSGWLLLNDHLMGRTILDVDGRRTEVVNDVHLLFSKGRMVVAHVDVSFNGFLRKWGLRFLVHDSGRLVSWRYVQPLSVEDVGAKKDTLSLSVTRRQMHELPGEDLADVLETLSGKEQQAVFSALDSEKAAEVLVEAEPRAQRQLLANLRQERARTIMSELSVPQIADLFSVLPHDHMTNMMRLLPPEEAARIQRILADREANAQTLMSSGFVTFPREVRVGEALRGIRARQGEHDSISYIYVVERDNVLVGVVDLRDLVLAQDAVTLGEMMIAPVVSAEREDVREDLAELFAKYHFRMLPVVDDRDHLLGVIHYTDIMKGLVARAKI